MANSGIKVEFGDLIVNENNEATATVGLYIDGTKVVGAQGAVVADCTAQADGTSAGTQLNLLLAELRTHGIIATA